MEHRASNVVPFWVWYGFLVRTLVRATKSTTLEGRGSVYRVEGCGQSAESPRIA